MSEMSGFGNTNVLKKTFKMPKITPNADKT